MLNKSLKFSGKVKMSMKEGGILDSQGDYSLGHKPWRDSNYNFSHNSKGETSLDGYFWFHERKNHNLNFQLYKNCKLTQNVKERVADCKTHLRVLHPNFIFSAGYEKFNPVLLCGCKGEEARETTETKKWLPNLSFWGLGHRKFNQLSLWGGLGLSFALARNQLDNVKFLAGGNCSNSKTKAVGEVVLTRSDKEEKNVMVQSAKLYLDNTYINNYKVGGSVEYDIEAKDKVFLKWAVANEYKIDPNTKVKARFNQAYTLSGALVHTFANVANFALMANFNLVPQKEGSLGHLKYKFGTYLEFFDL